MTGPTYLWRYARVEGRLQHGLATAATAWLGAMERQQADRIRDAARRRSWLVGRVLAKQVVLAVLARAESGPRAIAPQQIEVDSGGMGRRGKQPVVTLNGQRWPRSISITHTRDAVLVAAACLDHVRVGVDLVGRVHLGNGFRRLWFTAAERQCLKTQSFSLPAARLWAVKEAVFKASNRGEAFRPADIEVVRQPPDGRFASSYAGVPLPPSTRIRVAQFDGHTAAMVSLSEPKTV